MVVSGEFAYKRSAKITNSVLLIFESERLHVARKKIQRRPAS